MSKEYFIRNIEIKNFKCFEDFKAEGFSRVNLIGGKNNVGKTAFMEALFFNTNIDDTFFESFIKVLISIEVHRDYSIVEEFSDMNLNTYLKFILSFLRKYLNLSLFSNVNNISISNMKKLEIKLNNELYTNEDLNPVFMNREIVFSSNFISSLFIDTEQLMNLYDGVKLLRKREEINKFINTFDNDILEYDIIDSTPQCFSKKNNNFISLSEYGNGLKRYIAYVCAIWANQDGYIFIDEIENGIHYTNLDKLWEIILKTSKEANCQVFATTHSKECIEAYARVAEELKDKEITFFKLGKNKKGEIKGMVYPYEWFIDSIEQEEELRGW